MAADAPTKKMELRPLGGSGLDVAVVCLGTMTMGEQNTRKESFAIMDRALERGVNFWDTAELYAVPPRERARELITEQIIGDWLTARSKDDPDLRSRLILATKVASRMPGVGPRGFIVQNRYENAEAATAAGADKIECPDLTRDQILTACDASLKRLQSTYIDLYQLHWPSRYAPVFGKRQYDYASASAEGSDGASIEESVQAIGELIKSGKIRHWGLSNETPFGLCKFAEAAKKLGVPPPVSVQNDYSLLDREFDGGNAEACHPKNLNIGLIAYGCLAGGGLSGKYLGGAKPAGARHTLFPGFQPRYVCDRALAATADYAALAEKKGLTPTALALAWAASRPFMSSVIIGATTLKQLDECIDACLVKLDEETLKAVDELFLKHGNAVLTD
jgi:aryl-alcohol dehydrogenase-like predicted oxidoreductase